MSAAKPDFYCWPCDRRYTLPGDGYPPQSGIVTCKYCGSTDVYWLRPESKDALRAFCEYVEAARHPYPSLTQLARDGRKALEKS